MIKIVQKLIILLISVLWKKSVGHVKKKNTVSFGVVIFLILLSTLLEKEHDLSIGVNHKSYPVKPLKDMWSGISNTRQNKMSWSHASRRCRWPLVKDSVTLVLWYHKYYLQETVYILRIKMCSGCSKALTSQHLVLVYGKFCGNVILSYILRMARIMAKPHNLNIVLENLSPKRWGF